MWLSRRARLKKLNKYAERNASIDMNGTTQNLSLASYQMSLSINRAQRAFNTLMKTCLSHHGLTIPEWSVLGYLYEASSMRPLEVASSLGVKPPFIAKLITVLSDKQLITSELFPDDERGKVIRLTEQGRTLVQEVEVKLEHCLNGQLGAIEKSDLQLFFELNNYIAANVRHH